MKIIVTIAFLLVIPFQDKDTDVFICSAKGAKKYHYKESCRGLNACNTKAVKKNIKEAKALGLTLCGWED